MYRVTVRDHIMIAHSFDHELFGPAQALHGATFVVDATFAGPELDSNGVLLDIGRATEGLREILAGLNYRNLDDHPDFAGRNTTTEVIAHWVTDRLVALTTDGQLGREAAAFSEITVTLHESHIASASYTQELG